MLRFESDYLEGADPRVLSALLSTNEEQTPGYETDLYCDRARALIRSLCRAEEAEVQFIIGGTLTNTVVLAAALRPYQGVLCAESGHIAQHETGAIEMNGHKVLTLPAHNGKVDAADVREALCRHFGDGAPEHTVQPGAVYISQPTEIGTLYSKKELTSLSSLCREYGIPLYLDGARLGYALASPENDVTLPDIAALCDAFYIGGTKVGALFGEALVIPSKPLAKDIRYFIKQHGSLLAKGRLMGLQFTALLENGHYEEIAEKANALAFRLRDGFAALGFPFLVSSPTNQQFPILPNALLEKLGEKYSFSYWQKIDETHTAVRFCTSVLTKEEHVAALLADLETAARKTAY